MEDNSISNIDSDEIFRSCKLCSLSTNHFCNVSELFYFFQSEVNVENTSLQKKKRIKIKKISLFYSLFTQINNNNNKN